MIANIDSYYQKLGGSQKEREDGSELQRIIRIVKNSDEADSSQANEEKQRKNKKKPGRQNGSVKSIQAVIPQKPSKGRNDWSIHREEELYKEVANKDQMLDLTRRVWVV